jgi:hypothetical protein
VSVFLFFSHDPEIHRYGLSCATFLCSARRALLRSKSVGAIHYAESECKGFYGAMESRRHNAYRLGRMVGWWNSAACEL